MTRINHEKEYKIIIGLKNFSLEMAGKNPPNL